MVNKTILAAVGWQALSGVMFVCMTAVVKHAGEGIPALQSAFLRFALGLVFVIPALPMIWRIGLTRQTGALVFGRGVIHAVGVMFWFYALTSIPLAEVTAINFLSPVYVLIGAALIFGERFTRRRLAVVVMAVIGAAIVLRPGFRTVDLGHLAMLGCSLGMGGGYLFAKKLSGVMPASLVVAWLSIAVSLCLAPFAIATWQPVSWDVVFWLFLAGAFASGAHYAMTRGFALAPMAVTQPVTFLQLVWSSLVGLALFGEALDPLVVLGGLVIIAAVVWSSWGDMRPQPKSLPPVAPPVVP